MMKANSNVLSADAVRAEMGNLDASISEVRDYLEKTGRDRHTRLKIASVEALLISETGKIYGYQRIPEQQGGDKELSLFGGTVKGEEASRRDVCMVIMHKTPVRNLMPDQVMLYLNSNWAGDFEYTNGDKALFERAGAVVRLNKAQEEQLLNGPKKQFHEQIKSVVEIDKKNCEDLYEHQREIYRQLAFMAMLTE